MMLCSNIDSRFHQPFAAEDGFVNWGPEKQDGDLERGFGIFGYDHIARRFVILFTMFMTGELYPNISGHQCYGWVLFVLFS